ncbi:hypothetical protein ASD54_07480 [Rhizobium sp. Root149]|nr:hypothetical protein ASD54_07480 [Rhizobium sp. Root149]
MSLLLQSERASVEKEPTLEKGEALINSIRFYGEREGDTPEEAMTATSAALYEYLMARVRPQLAKNEPCRVPFADAKEYLQLEKSSRLMGHMKALSSTWVSYDFLDVEEGFEEAGERVQLMNCSVSTKAGERFIKVEMFPSVRKAILAAKVYTHLELGAFPRFSSKYAHRLYPRLALMAGRELRPPMRWTPQELAEILGWKPPTWKFGNFEARVLNPVIADIHEHVRRFEISCEYVRGAGRGHPVTEIVITVGNAAVTPEEIQKAEMDRSARTRVRRIAKDAAVDDTTQMPAEDHLRRAATRLGEPATVVASMWTEAFADERIMEILQKDGLNAAFESWVQRQEGTISVILAEGYGLSDIAPVIDDHLWTGNQPRTLRVVWNADGERRQRDFEVNPTDRDLGHFWMKNEDLIADLDMLDLEVAA